MGWISVDKDKRWNMCYCDVCLFFVVCLYMTMYAYVRSAKASTDYIGASEESDGHGHSHSHDHGPASHIVTERFLLLVKIKKI